jgi:hypothetical protein
MRLIIPCAGEAKRWDLAMPKHLLPICGEPIMPRTIRLAVDIDPDIDIHVVVNDLSDDRYKVPGSRRATARRDPARGEIDKVLSSRHLWNRDGLTVYAWGDIWWQSDTLRQILTADVEDWWWWGRLAGDGGELFALAFGPDAHDDIEAACDAVAAAHARGEMTVPAPQHTSGVRAVPGGWGLYRALHGKPVTDHADHGHLTHVDNWTEDFDSRTDWERWCARYYRTDPAERDRMVV